MRGRHDSSLLNYDPKKIRQLQKLLDTEQKSYTKIQESKFKDIVEKSHSEHLKTIEKNHALLLTCKTWGGPCTNTNELKMIKKIAATKKILLKKVLKSEISFRKITTPRDAVERPHLYKLNTLSEEKLEQNLTTLLQTEFRKPLEMPDEAEILELIKTVFKES